MKEVISNVNLDKLKDGIYLAARGGGIRSCVSIGVLRALEEANIPIKGISGESLSSLFAALVVTGHTSEEILELFLKYNQVITKSSKLYGGRGSIVIEEIVNRETNNTLIKDANIDCYINACTGKLLKPELVLFSKEDTPNETFGTACRASASLPILFGNCTKEINGKEYNLFDGGLLLNPYIPDTEYPILYASFHNYIDYYKYLPMLKKTIDRSNKVSSVIINAPVGNILITGSNKDMEKAYLSGYNEAKKVLKL